jgi:hypothetical protein
VLPIIALLLFTGAKPDADLMKRAASQMRTMTRVEVEQYETASSAHLALVNQFRRRLLTWVEQQLPPTSANNEDCAKKAAQLTSRLRDAGILVSNPESELLSLSLSRPPEYPEMLLLRIDIDLPFGVDGAAYLYAARDGRWKRILASERKQNRIGNSLTTVALSPAGPDGSHLLLTVVTPAVNVGCVHAFGYDLYRIGPAMHSAVRLLSRGETSDVCAGQGEVSMESDGFRIDFVAITRNAERRGGVVHYQVIGDQVRRVAPVALRPEDFVDEWAQRSWREALEWSVRGNQKDLRKSHEALPKLLAEYASTRRCGKMDRWQVTINAFSKDANEIWYGLVRQGEDHQFKMIEVGRKSRPECQ